jgi:hypothetical protein
MKHRIRLLVVTIVLVAVAGAAFAQKGRINKYHKALSQKLSAMVQSGQTCKVNMNDSEDGNGMDAEIRLTMGIREFESFAPIAALEAAALPHKFNAVNIYLRHEATGRVGRINFRDAEPLAAMYKAGEREDATSEMADSITWH